MKSVWTLPQIDLTETSESQIRAEFSYRSKTKNQQNKC